MRFRRETDLYPAVKAFLERQGYEVKAEIKGCDVVGVRGAEPPVIVELKLAFNLALLLQGLDRLAMTDAVYLAVPMPGRRAGAASVHSTEIRKLCRRIGLGLLTVDPAGPVESAVHVVLDPLPYQPRKDAKRKRLMLGEHARRVGDPNTGGANRAKLVTAYRQEALRCAAVLAREGTAAPAQLRVLAAAPRAGTILLRDVYGWFLREGRGRYALSPAGRAALQTYAGAFAEAPYPSPPDPSPPAPDEQAMTKPRKTSKRKAPGVVA